MTTTATTTTTVARAGRADVGRVSSALAQAFQDDPVVSWVTPDAARRRALLPAMFRVFTETYLGHDRTYVAGDGGAAALWAPAGVEPVPASEADRFGQRLADILGEDADRALELDTRMDELHPTEACYYLAFLGVVPGRQGRGLGGALLSTVLRRCDAEAAPAYLEATSVDNRRLYARHGFATVGEIALPDGPTLWRMWREPAGRGVHHGSRQPRRTRIGGAPG